MSPTKFLSRKQVESPDSFPSGIEKPIVSDSSSNLIDVIEISRSVESPSTSQILAPNFSNTEHAKYQSANLVLQPRLMPFWKRSFDVLTCSLLMVLLSPLLICIAVVIKLGSRGPILFKQARLGYAGREFIIYKFRTLKPLRDASEQHRQYVAELMNSDDAAIKPDLQDRLIPGGGWLRRLSLDELPQLINILKKEMSLIGPRPDVLLWKDYEPCQLKRFEVQPGVTGLWQVSGKNRLSFNQMIEKDLEYIGKRSIRFDLLITIKTVMLLFRQDNG